MDAQVQEATRRFIARRDRAENPPGTFDRAGRFYAAEELDCCCGIRYPSRAWPYSQMTHARTAAHVAALLGVDASIVRKLARQLDKAN